MTINIVCVLMCCPVKGLRYVRLGATETNEIYRLGGTPVRAGPTVGQNEAVASGGSCRRGDSNSSSQQILLSPLALSLCCHMASPGPPKLACYLRCIVGCSPLQSVGIRSWIWNEEEGMAS